MDQEQYLLSFVPQITATTDPLQDVIDPQLNDYHDTVKKLETTKAEFAALEEPPRPEENSKPGGCLSAVVGVVLLVVLLIAEASFGAALAIGVIVSLSMFIGGKIYHKMQVEDYYDYLDKVEYYKNTINSLEIEVNEKFKDLQGKLAIRFEALRFALTKNLGLPYPMSSITLESYPKIKKCYLTLLQKKEDIGQISDSKKRQEAYRAFIDEKIAFLYAHSLRAELSEDVYDEFKQQLLGAGPGNMLLRQTNAAGRYSKGMGEIFCLPQYKAMLDDDHLSPIISKYEAVSRRNTKGLFFDDLDKKERQTNDMKALLDAATYEYDELKSINVKISYALNYARGCAYRNLYLASELINYVSGSVRGGGLTMVHDKVNSPAAVWDTAQDFELDGLDENSDISAIDMISYIGSTVIDDSSLLQLASNNPKFVLGVAAVAAL